MAYWTRDYCFEELLRNEAAIRGAEGANEDTTRVRAIDTILFDVLGWDRLAVETEKYCRAVGFSDYAFTRQADICLIVEAKRSDVTFVLPNRKYSAAAVGFALLAHESPAAEAAMIQAAGYAASLGANYVAITNGHQWILALPYVPQQPISQRSVFVFESYEAIRERFDSFFRYFGPEGIFANLPAGGLLEVRKAPAPAKRSSSFPSYPEPADRNVIVNELAYIIDLVWNQMDRKETSEEFLRQCYIPPAPSEDGLAVAKELFSLRQSADARGRSDAIESSAVAGLVTTLEPEKPIVVLGRIGHGKSTFLKYLRLVKAKDELEHYIQIDIDFLDRPDAASDVADYIYAEVNQQLLNKYAVDVLDDSFARGVLRSELQRFRTSSTGKLYADDKVAYAHHEVSYLESLQRDSHAYLARAFRHLRKGRGKSVAIFFDNLDRRDDLLDTTFLKASGIARDWECLVFVCLRPTTFHQSRDKGVLDSISPKVINVVSPPTNVLLKKRFHYAREVAEGNTIKGAGDHDIKVHLPRVAQLLECCEDSFFKNKTLTQVFEAVSNGNIRDLLIYVRDFLLSLHLDTKKIIRRFNEPGGYRIPEHEAIRALLYGDFAHFDPTHSPFINIFDISRSDPLEHFSRFLLLHFLNRIQTGPPQRGYSSCDEIMQYLCQLGFSAEHVRDTLALLLERECCELRIPGSAIAASDGQLRATPLGRYHINHLSLTFQYMDAITIDTPIMSVEVRSLIIDDRFIDKRLIRCRAFVEYLDECSESLKDADAIELWKVNRDAVLSNIDEIEAAPR